MTNKEKWDIALQEYIHESDILEKARALFVYPYTKLSSVEKNEVTHEKLFCPYCFEKFNYKYRTNRRPYDEKIICPNCKHEYGQNYSHSGTMYPTRIEFAGDYYSKDKLYYSSREALYVDMSTDGKLAVRIIKHEFSFGDKITVEHTEKERIYLFPTSAEYQWTSIRNRDGYLRYLKNGGIEHGGYLNREITAMPEAQEKLRYTGFTKYIDSALHDSASTYEIVRYLSVIFDHPALEKIIKMGWRELADDYVTKMLSSLESKMYSSNGALHEVIGIPKRLIKQHLRRKEKRKSRISPFLPAED